MIEITGSVEWADWLERVSFNALPTQISDDFDAPILPAAQPGGGIENPRNFVTCYHGTDQLFGLLTGYPCCTSNLHQGWPKFTRHLWYASDDNGLAALYYSPCVVTAKVGQGTLVKIEEKTDYPFDETIRFRIDIPDKATESVEFPLYLRIPGWCEEAELRVNGEPLGNKAGGEMERISRVWKSGDEVELVLPMKVTVSRWYEGSAVVERGPLVYALKMEEKWVKVPDDHKFGTRYGNWYYEVHSSSPWNYCLKEESIREENIASEFQVVKRG